MQKGNGGAAAPSFTSEARAPDPLGRAGSGLAKVWILTATILAVALSINQLFNLGFFVDYTIPSLRYYYLLLALLLPLVFIIWPARKAAEKRVPLYDVLLAIGSTAIMLFFVVNAQTIVDEAWEYSAPQMAVVASIALWVIAIEATRRAGGLVLTIIALVFSLYPTVAELIPGPIQGQQTSFSGAAIFHAMSSESIMGIPMRAFAGLIIGFLVFGVALQRTGGGRFFMDIAFGLLGHTRGGPAKVAIFGSALMGSMSGSVITNILTTGTLTIPAMQRTGFSRSYAAGIETCASTGAVLMPPIMGATAFVMATFLEIDYALIALAAVVPSALYFLGLFVQIDAYAARNGLVGLPKADLPRLRRTLREGWHYLLVFALLIWMLLYLKREAVAPYYATAMLLVINQLFPRNRWRWRDLVDFVGAVGRLLIELVGILVGIGLIIGALAAAGMTGTLTNDLIHIAGGSVGLLLIMGALTSFILGMGMTVTAAYIFLAVTLAPALVKAGIDPLAAHLFILYWGMLSYITPPVAIGAYAAATISGARPMRTGFVAMRLGSVIYIIPFLFVLSPALLLQGTTLNVGVSIVTALVGVVLIASSLQGYLVFVGSLTRNPVLQWPIRILLAAGGLVLSIPGTTVLFSLSTHMSNLITFGIALALVLPAIALAILPGRRAALGPAE